MNYMFKSIFGWFFPDTTIGIKLLFIFLFIIILGYILWINRREDKRYLINGLKELSPIIMYILLFFIFLLGLSSFSYFSINGRMLSPIFIPIIIVFTKSISLLIEQIKDKNSLLFVLVLIVIFFLIWIASIWRGSINEQFDNMYAGNNGLTSKSVRKNDVVGYIQSSNLESDCSLYSNYPDQVYILTGVNVSLTPTIEQYKSSVEKQNIGSSSEGWPPAKGCIVWIKGINRKDIASIADLGKISDIKVIKKLQAGIIYSVTTKITDNE
jgi:hypothetical protein